MFSGSRVRSGFRVSRSSATGKIINHGVALKNWWVVWKAGVREEKALLVPGRVIGAAYRPGCDCIKLYRNYNQRRGSRTAWKRALSFSLFLSLDENSAVRQNGEGRSEGKSETRREGRAGRCPRAREHLSYEDINQRLSWTMLAITYA